MAAVGELGYFTGAGHRRGNGKKEAVAVRVGWGRLRDLNPQPSDYKSDALPIAPSRHARTLCEHPQPYRAIALFAFFQRRYEAGEVTVNLGLELLAID